MDPESLVARTRAICQVARAIQRSLDHNEIADLVNTLEKVETISAARPNLAQAASLSARLESLSSRLVFLRELLECPENIVQVNNDGLSPIRFKRILKKDEMQRTILRIREEKKALEIAWLTMYDPETCLMIKHD